MGRLEDRVAVITGAGRGIGAAVAKTFATEGAAVVVNDLGASLTGKGTDTTPARQVVDAIRSSGGRAVADTGDISDFESSGRLVQKAIDEFGRLDVLVNVAGILRDRMLVNMSEAEWDDVIRVHLRGTFNTSRHAARWWRANRGGDYRLINFTSSAGLFGAPGQPNYAAAKMGIVGFTKSCANALSRYGVTSNAMAPGAVTRMTDAIPEEKVEGVGFIASDEMAPVNLTPIVVYLASTDSGWLNGRVVGAMGYRLTLYSDIEIEREVVSLGPWDVDRAFAEIERTFKPAVLGEKRFQSLGEAPR